MVAGCWLPQVGCLCERVQGTRASDAGLRVLQMELAVAFKRPEVAGVVQ